MNERKFLHPQVQGADELDLKRLLLTLSRHWYWLLAGVLLSLLAAYFYLQSTTPLYVIKSTLLIKEDKKGSDNTSTVFSEVDAFRAANNIENEMQVLKSKELIHRVLSELAMNVTYYEDGFLNDKELYGQMLPLRIAVNYLDSSAFGKSITLQILDDHTIQLEELTETDSLIVSTHSFGQEIKESYGAFTIVKGPNFAAYTGEKAPKVIVQFHDMRQLAGTYSSTLLVEPLSKTASVLSILLTEPVPEKGIDILNKLIEVYDREGTEDKNFLASKTINFLDERLQLITEELSNVEKDIEEYKRQHEITNVSTQAQSYVDNASEYKRQLADWSIQIDVLESLENYLKGQGEGYQLVPSSLGVRDETLLGLINKFNELQLERERMLRTAQPNNPLVQNIQVQLANLKVNILENLRNIKNGLIITRNNLRASSGQFESKIQQVPSIERHLLEINRQQGIKQGLYLHLLQKREESALALAATVSNIKVIDAAVADELPVSPNKPLVWAIALVLGLGLPAGLIFVKDFFNDKIRDKKEIELSTATPILGEIAHNPTNKLLVVTENSRTPVAELFRLLRINLNFSSVDRENKVIMITSSMSGEGKTFCSINLGASLAQTGKRVVILDLDLRKPKVLADLGMANDIGITDYIMSGAVDVDEIAKPVLKVPGLFVIGTGPLPPNPAEFIMSSKLGRLIKELKESCDHIIIDTAPVGQVADAFVLAPYVDTTLYMIRYDYTSKAQIGIINDIYKEKKLKNAMIVVNDAKKENSYGYGNGYGYDVSNKSVSRKKVYT